MKITVDLKEDEGLVRMNSRGEIWYISPNRKTELLSDKNSVCGIKAFRTGPNDPFRGCCEVHDHMYVNRAFFEARGWDRKDMDDYFRDLCLQRAGRNPVLIVRAEVYYNIVRVAGWVWYYRHPGYVPGTPIESIKLVER